jgi:hypothetical protein
MLILAGSTWPHIPEDSNLQKVVKRFMANVETSFQKCKRMQYINLSHMKTSLFLPLTVGETDIH